MFKAIFNSKIDEAIQNINPDYAITVWARRYLVRYGESSIDDMRTSIAKTLKELSLDFTKTSPIDYSKKKLTLPDNLKHLAGNFYGYTRSSIFSQKQLRQNNFVEYFRRRLILCQIPELVNSFYPKVYDLYDLVNFKSCTDYDLIIPRAVRPSKELIEYGENLSQFGDMFGQYRLILIDSGFKV